MCYCHVYLLHSSGDEESRVPVVILPGQDSLSLLVPAGKPSMYIFTVNLGLAIGLFGRVLVNRMIYHQLLIHSQETTSSLDCEVAVANFQAFIYWMWSISIIGLFSPFGHFLFPSFMQPFFLGTGIFSRPPCSILYALTY